jgi:hypothetical protein
VLNLLASKQPKHQTDCPLPFLLILEKNVVGIIHHPRLKPLSSKNALNENAGLKPVIRLLKSVKHGLMIYIRV